MPEPRDPLLKVFFSFPRSFLLPWLAGLQTAEAMAGWAASCAPGPPPGGAPGKQQWYVRGGGGVLGTPPGGKGEVGVRVARPRACA